MRAFEIAVLDSVLADLADRLARTRWPDASPWPDWDQGTPLGFLQDLIRHWRSSYDWRAAEASLNRFPQFVTEVDGQPIHFLHVSSGHPGALPLILSHGWPGSIVEFLNVIEPLTTPTVPTDAFDLVIPSLPGYGWSGPLTAPGWHPRRIASAFGEVMDRLGYDRYGVQGGDWGSVVSANLADLHPDRVAGLHLNFLTVPSQPGVTTAPHEPARRFAVNGSGYQQIQSTKPQTVGYLLDDSPGGLAGWIVEKFREWSDCNGDPCNSFSLDQLITNVMVYWVTRTATSAARLYWEMRAAGRAALPQAPVVVPTGVANFPGEIARSDRSDAERRYNIVHWTYPDHGGHFAAMEVPELFVQDVQAFFRLVR